MSALRVTVTGATGLIGPSLLRALQRARRAGDGAEPRSRARARATLGDGRGASAGSSMREPAPAAALAGRDAVVHLAGEPVAQRWSASAKRAIRDSRVLGTRNLVDGPRGGRRRRAAPAHADQLLGDRLLRRARRGAARRGRARRAATSWREVCVEWEREAAARGASSACAWCRCAPASCSTASGGALAKMLPPFRLGVGGPVAGGAPVHLVDPRRGSRRDDARGARRRALERAGQRDRAGAGQQPRVLEALGAVLAPPGAAAGARRSRCALLYGEMAEIVTTGARVVPAKALVLGYEFATRSSSRRCARRSARERDDAPARAAQAGAPTPARAPAGRLSRLDDHAAGPLAEQIGGGRPDPLLAGGRVDRRPVDHVRADAFGFLDERRAGVARADQAGVDLDARRAAPGCARSRAPSARAPPPPPGPTRATAGWAPAARRSRRRPPPRRSAWRRCAAPRR